MASCTSHHLWNPGLARSSDEEDYKEFRHKSHDLLCKDPSQCCNSKAGHAYPDFKHKVTKESLYIDGWYTPSWAGEVLRRRGLAMSEMTKKVVHGKPPDEGISSFVALLRSCSKTRDLYRGTKVHEDILKKGLLEKCLNTLVIMYVKCGALAKAEELLDMHNNGNVFSWTTLISCYTRQGRGHNALNCFDRMQLKGLSPDAVTFVCVLKACGIVKAIHKGAQIHDEVLRQGLLENNIVLGTALVDMYAKCGAVAKARRVLEELPCRDVFSWSSLIQGYAQYGQCDEALSCLEQMQWEGLSPDAVTFSCILKACSIIGAVEEGERIHDKIARQGLLGNNIILGTALVDMYAKCGALGKAQCMLEELPFRDVISWNALIAGYAQQDQGEQALNCFERMQQEGLSPDAMTFTSILKACGSIGALDRGEHFHDEIDKQGLLANDILLGSALVDMYARCGALTNARRVLEDLPARNVVSWSALIAGYAQQGQGEQALGCFERMQREGLSPDAVTFVCILKACGSIGAADKGEQIHDEIARQGLLGNDIVLGNALVDMYAKCGSLSKAQRVLEELPTRDVVSWNTLITGFAQQGQGKQALNCFERMQREGLSPDAVTFSCVLNVCSHLGMVEDGHMHFVSMSRKYGIQPDLEHYTCMVDLFGRAGHLDKAVRVIQEMPSSDVSAVWSALLGACRKWGDVSVGRWAFEQAVQVDKCDSANYILMANIYAAAGMQEDAESIEAMRRENKAW